MSSNKQTLVLTRHLHCPEWNSSCPETRISIAVWPPFSSVNAMDKSIMFQVRVVHLTRKYWFAQRKKTIEGERVREMEEEKSRDIMNLSKIDERRGEYLK